MTVLTGGPKVVKCSEDDDFMTAFDRMMVDNLQVWLSLTQRCQSLGYFRFSGIIVTKDIGPIVLKVPELNSILSCTCSKLSNLHALCPFKRPPHARVRTGPCPPSSRRFSGYRGGLLVSFQGLPAAGLKPALLY